MFVFMDLKYLSIFLILLCACVSQENDTGYISNLYSERDINFNPDVEFCVVLPEVGCSGCISSVIYHILDNKSSFSNDQKKNLIVFTAINSKKMLKRNMEIESLDELNCILDSNNVFLLDTDKKIYPIIMTLHDGKIVESQIQSPDNTENAFKKLFKN